jgi:hypothetical protein
MPDLHSRSLSLRIGSSLKYEKCGLAGASRETTPWKSGIFPIAFVLGAIESS